MTNTSQEDRLPPLPEPTWIAVDTPGADFDTSFVQSEDEALDLTEGSEYDRNRTDLFTADQMRDYAQASIAALLAQDGAGEWRPIATKPKGETLLYYPVTTGRNAQAEWITIGYGNVPRKATHWMQLPASPLAAAPPAGGEGL